MSEPPDVQPVRYDDAGEPYLVLTPGHWLLEARRDRRGRWRVTGSQTVPEGELGRVRYTSDGDHHLVRVRRAA